MSDAVHAGHHGERSHHSPLQCAVLGGLLGKDMRKQMAQLRQQQSGFGYSLINVLLTDLLADDRLITIVKDYQSKKYPDL